MATFLFLNRWIGYTLGIVISLIAVVFFGNCSSFLTYSGEFSWQYFALDIFFGTILAYSIGLLVDAVCMFYYLKSLRAK
jgi:hypothetical protein